ncbi:ankyrin repeat domain-containing protein [Candidatus Dependentiae bacterium]|nr:ankyrin repeat domain-containing protein [Candidatus Dependentiae bacterium]
MSLLLVCFILFSSSSFALERKISAGKEEIGEPMEIVPQKGKRKAEEVEELKKKKLASEQFSYLENLPWDKLIEIIDHAVDPLIDKIQSLEKQLLEFKASAKKESSKALKAELQMLSSIYEVISELIVFRSYFISTSKKFSEAKSYIDTKIVRAVRNINQSIKNNFLGFAIFDDNESAISLLIQAGANPNAEVIIPGIQFDIGTSFETVYPVTLAVYRNSIPMLQLLIKKGAIIAQREQELESRKNLLYIAAYKNYLDMAKFLIEKLKLNPSTPEDTYGKTPLHIAAEKNFLEMAKFLAQHKVNVNAQEKYDKRTPLVRAAYSANKDMVQILLENGANPNPEFIIHGTGTVSLLPAIEDYIINRPSSYILRHPEKKQIYIEIIELLKKYGEK